VYHGAITLHGAALAFFAVFASFTFHAAVLTIAALHAGFATFFSGTAIGWATTTAGYAPKDKSEDAEKNAEEDDLAPIAVHGGVF
jgi:hypothetical protein